MMKPKKNKANNKNATKEEAPEGDPVPKKNKRKSKGGNRKQSDGEDNEDAPKKKGRRRGQSGEDNKLHEIDFKEKPNEKEVSELFPETDEEEEGKLQLQIPLPDDDNYKTFYSHEIADEDRICEADPKLDKVRSFDVRSALHDEIEDEADAHELRTNKCPVCEKGVFIRKDSVLGWIACFLCFPLGGPIWCRKACSNYVCNKCGASKY